MAAVLQVAGAERLPASASAPSGRRLATSGQLAAQPLACSRRR